MTNLINVLYNYAKPHFRKMIIVLSVIIFGYFAYYGYRKFYLRKYSEGMDVANANRRSNTVKVYFFHADWCPHCKKAQPEWDLFMNNYNGTEVNGYKVECVDVNCTTETPTEKELMNEFKIESFPTIKMVKDDKTIEFESKIKTSTLEKFVETMLN